MKVYRIAKGWAIFIYIFSPVLIAAFSWTLIMPFVSEDVPRNVAYFLVPLSLGMLVLMIVGILDTAKGKVIVSDTMVSLRSTFINRDLVFHEIKGYVIEDKYILIIPHDGPKKRIKISTYIGKSNELISWLHSHFPNLHELKAGQEESEILTDPEYGQTEEDRSHRLVQAKTVAKILNVAGALVCAWTLFKPEPYEYAILASISIPIISILVVAYFKGLIRLDQNKGSAYPSISLAVLLTSCGLFLRAQIDYDIFDYSNVWVPSITIAVVLTALVVLSTREFKFKEVKDYFTVLFASLFLLGYGYGAVVTLNCIYDENPPEVYHSTVLGKRISSSRRSTTHYLELEAWATQIQPEDVSVSENFYDHMQVDDSVTIHLYKGRLSIRWFEVSG